MTVYKALKVSNTRPGQFMVISGIGGLGHIAVQYAKAMGMRPIAVDIADSKLELATSLGAEFTGGGSHGVLVTAVHEKAFGQALGMTRINGTIVFNGLPPGEFPVSVFDVVFRGLTITGSLVGTRQDIEEALDFYARGLIKPKVAECALDDVADVLDKLEHGGIDGRVAIRY